MSYDVVKEILHQLIKKYPNQLDIKQIEFTKMINYLKIHNRAKK